MDRTIGYGDIAPSTQNNAEMMFTTVVEFLGMFVFSYTVSNMAELVVRPQATCSLCGPVSTDCL